MIFEVITFATFVCAVFKAGFYFGKRAEKFNRFIKYYKAENHNIKK